MANLCTYCTTPRRPNEKKKNFSIIAKDQSFFAIATTYNFILTTYTYAKSKIHNGSVKCQGTTRVSTNC